VQGKDIRQLFDFHALLSLLQAATRVAEEFILVAEGLAGREIPEASSDRGVLLNVHREVQERFVPVGNLFFF